MKRILLILFLAATMPLGAFAAESPQAFKGWPGHDDITDLKGCFENPPKGYGNVPFYWWTGDPLDMERLTEQLDLLANSPTDGLCVSYNHTHDKVDIEINAEGHGNCGRVSGGEPRVMSPEWWKIWNRFSAKCADKGLGLGMDDYVLAWPGNGEHMDSVILSSNVRNYQGKLELRTLANTEERPATALSILRNNLDSTTYICTAPSPWLYPDIGNILIDKYFSKFVKNMDEKGLRGMNYFFQDELQYDLGLTSWCEDMPVQFIIRKGYNVVPYLADLFITDPEEIDGQAARIRLDYAEVLTQLAEERFFRPIYEWNAERGLIYGCDNEGRGLRPLQYLDYFRATSWFTAPGNDAPSRGSSFRQTKVSSSIAHLYGRPRTWLEAFHSIGWDANGALLKAQLDHHIIAGGNLLCMHGLYYSTHGGWWEWAPPCFHFRMPYWSHMKLWLKYAERMCFLLSQGTHVCDVAILYPTETMQAYPGATPETTFALSDSLSTHGIDYDFIDYQSIRNAEINDSRLEINGESYRVLFLVDTKAVHRETFDKILAFHRAGGIVIGAGFVMPPLLNAGVRTIDGPESAVEAVRGLINGDFRSSGDDGRVLHRKIGERDVYMVMDVKKGEEMYFRTLGAPEKWDAMDASTEPLEVIGADEEGTWIRFDGESGSAMLVVFSPGTPEEIVPDEKPELTAEVHLDGDWNITIVPTMDNKWGDFRLPASNELIGVEAREIKYSEEDSDIYGYGPYMMSFTADSTEFFEQIIAEKFEGRAWEPYSWSWQYGVKDNPGAQGWHGLKAKVDSRFLILDRGGHQFFKTNVYAPKKGHYRIFVEGVEPDYFAMDGLGVTEDEISLRKGWHTLILGYAGTEKKDYNLSDKKGSFTDDRDRSMVMFYPSGGEEPQNHGMYDDIVASRWFGTDFLPYDINRQKRTRYEMEFETAPGTSEMNFKVNGKVKKIFIDGEKVRFKSKRGKVNVKIAEINPGISKVSVLCIPKAGYPGAAFFASPVKMVCRGGRLPEGDWTKFGALGFYSGGIRYEKSISMPRTGGRIVLDLGEVDATCEVKVNGKFVKTLISGPYSVDITNFVRQGDNHIDVLVYSTLSNHYRTIPSPYRGTPHAGLIGPVRILY